MLARQLIGGQKYFSTASCSLYPLLIPIAIETHYLILDTRYLILIIRSRIHQHIPLRRMNSILESRLNAIPAVLT